MKSQASKAGKKSGIGRLLVKLLIVLIVILALLVGGVWVWSGSNGSLATALKFAPRFLGQGRTLEVADVQGSIRHGGKIGTLRFTQDGLVVNMSGVDFAWDAMALISNKLNMEHLTVEMVQVLQPPKPETGGNAAPSAEKSMPETPPQNVGLPLQVDIKRFSVSKVLLGEKAEDVVASNISGSYLFDGTKHVLALTSLDMADGHYTATVDLTAVNPVLDAQITGVLATQVPESTQILDVDAKASVAGPLTELKVNAQAQTRLQSGVSASGPKAQLQAVVKPWDALMIPQADLSLQAFNMQAFWPQAPQTLLSGTVHVTTAGEQGTQQARLNAQLKNGVTGALDKNGLPVSSLTARAVLANRAITVTPMDIGIGSGHITGSASYTFPQPGGVLATWQLDAKLDAVDPRRLYSTVASDAVSGTVQVSQKSTDKIIFDMNLNARGANIAQFPVTKLIAIGSLANSNVLRLTVLDVITPSASVKGSPTVVLSSTAVSGPLSLSAPGLTANTTLSNFAAQSGSARVSLNVNAADSAVKWLRGLRVDMGDLLPFLENAARYTQNIANYTQVIPILVEGGWQNHRVRPDIDVQALLKKIIEEEARKHINEQLEGKLGDSPLGNILGGHGGSSQSGAGNRTHTNLGEALEDRLRDRLRRH